MARSPPINSADISAPSTTNQAKAKAKAAALVKIEYRRKVVARERAFLLESGAKLATLGRKEVPQYPIEDPEEYRLSEEAKKVHEDWEADNNLFTSTNAQDPPEDHGHTANKRQRSVTVKEPLIKIHSKSKLIQKNKSSFDPTRHERERITRLTAKMAVTRSYRRREARQTVKPIEHVGSVEQAGSNPYTSSGAQTMYTFVAETSPTSQMNREEDEPTNITAATRLPTPEPTPVLKPDNLAVPHSLPSGEARSSFFNQWRDHLLSSTDASTESIRTKELQLTYKYEHTCEVEDAVQRLMDLTQGPDQQTFDVADEEQAALQTTLMEVLLVVNEHKDRTRWKSHRMAEKLLRRKERVLEEDEMEME